MIAQLEKPAPDFEASAFIDGSFKNVKLSNYRGRWVAL
jgi:peroxiredoxin (alkyl hydroperoxide reductase subunit C)